MRKRNRILFFGLVAAAAAMALVVAGTASATTTFNSGSNPGATGPAVMNYTGNGFPVSQMCGNSADPGQGGYQNGATASNYQLWILNDDGGSISGGWTLTVGGVTYGNSSANQLVTPAIDPTGAQANFDVATTGTGAWILTISHGCSGVPSKDLTVSKTATPADNLTYGWGINKAADKTTFDIPLGQQATANYTVTVTHDSGTLGGWTESGSITVTNPNNFDVTGVTVTDSNNNGGSCSVTDGTNVTVPANDSVQLNYSCTYSSAPVPGNGTDTATAAWPDINSPHTSATGMAGFDFAGVTPTIIDGSVTVTDTLDGTLGTVNYTDPSPSYFHYSQSFSGNGGTCTEYDNTATFTTNTTGTTGSDSAAVHVCVGENLQVSKTANPAFKFTYVWNIHKAVDKTNLTLFSGTGTFTYTVNVGHDSGTASGWMVKGTITVTNPNDWEAITFDLSDAIDNGGTCTIDGGGTGLTVAASDSTTAHYTCTYGSAPNPASGTNTATAAWDKAAFSTPAASASGMATADFGAVTPTIIDNCVSVSDPIDPNSPHNFCVGDTGDPNFSFMYTRTVPAPPMGTCVSYDNTATFTTNTTGKTGSDSKTVTVCATNPPLTPGYWKNHLSVAHFPQPLGNYSVNTAAKATAVLNAMNCSSTTSQNAIGCLAGHLLAAEFNLANNSNICIQPVVDKANAFLKGLAADGVTGIVYTGPSGTYNLSTAQRNEAITLKNALDKYNNGGGC